MGTRPRPEETKRNLVREIVQSVLQEKMFSLEIQQILIKEKEDLTEVSCSFTEFVGKKKKSKKFKYQTVGAVNGLFNGVANLYSEEYQSLKNIKFSGFCINADIDTRKTPTGADSEVLVVLETENRDGKVMIFRHKGRSINSSSARVVFDSIEFYINCEKAFSVLCERVGDAKRRGRYDVSDRYTSQLVEIVNVTTLD